MDLDQLLDDSEWLTELQGIDINGPESYQPEPNSESTMEEVPASTSDRSAGPSSNVDSEQVMEEQPTQESANNTDVSTDQSDDAEHVQKDCRTKRKRNVDSEQVMEEQPTSANNTESDVTSDQSDDTERIQKDCRTKRKRTPEPDVEEHDKPSQKKAKISKEEVTGDEPTTSCWEQFKDIIGRVITLTWSYGQRSHTNVSRTDENSTDVESECPDQNCTDEDEVEIKSDDDQDMDDLLEHLRDVDGEKRDPSKGALKIMDKVFTDEEMSSHCFENVNGRCKKPALDRARVKRLKQCLKQHYGKSVYSENKKDIIKRCNQKCRDKCRDKGKKKK